MDAFGRRLHYLRLSITDLCNLRCLYCMPAGGVEKLEHSQVLRLEELARQQALEEQRRQEEEARQRALMEDILNTLSTAGEETKSFTADSEKVEEVFEESDLED